MHRFNNNNIIISDVLPNFIINWLNNIKIISSNKDSLNYFKNSCYIQILIYLVTMGIIIIL